jgi:hypothetical protein
MTPATALDFFAAGMHEVPTLRILTDIFGLALRLPP